MNIRNQVAVVKPVHLQRLVQSTRALALSTILLSAGRPAHAFFPSSDLPTWQLQQPSLEQLQLRDEIRNRVQDEVDIAFRRTTALLNAFLMVLTLFPTAAAITVWVLMGKLAKQTAIAEQEIESLKYDTLSQLKAVLAEAQTVLDELKQRSTEVESAQEETEILFPDSRLQEFTPVNYTTQYKQFLSASDYAKQGDACFFENRYEDAINAYNQALQIQPDLADTWNNRGVVLTRLQRYQDALASYEQATTIRPNYADAWNNRGVALLEMQQYQEAIGCCEKALQAKPDYADAWNNRGVAFSKMQQYEEAIASYNRALQIKNDYTDAWNNRGVALAKLNKYDAAIDSYNQATKIRPDFYRLWYNKARCYALQGNLELALENLKRAINLNPNFCKQLAKQEPDFNGIRQNEQFSQLVKE